MNNAGYTMTLLANAAPQFIAVSHLLPPNSPDYLNPVSYKVWKVVELVYTARRYSTLLI